MNYKRMIIIEIIMLITIFVVSPHFSLAVVANYPIGAGESSVSVDFAQMNSDAMNINGMVVGGSSTIIGGAAVLVPELIGTAITMVPVTFADTGLVQCTNTMGYGVPANTVLLRESRNADGTVSLVPASTYTYVSRDENGNVTNMIPMSDLNNSSTRTFSTYVNEGEQYYMAFLTDENNVMYTQDKYGYATIETKFIAKPDGMEIAETEIPSTTFSAPTLTGKETFYGQTTDGTFAGVDLTETRDFVNGNNNGNGEGNSEENTEGEGNNPDDDVLTQEEVSFFDDDIDDQLEQAHSELEEHNNSDFEKIITWFLVKGIGDNIRILYTKALGANVTIDDLLFNHYSNTRLAIFSSGGAGTDSGNSFLNSTGYIGGSGSSGILESYFGLFQKIAMVCYLTILLYIGVRVLAASTGSKKEQYKSMLTDWLKGVIILALFPYVMNYAIKINNGIVSYVETLKNTTGVNINLPSLAGVTSETLDALGIENVNTGDMMNNMRAYALSTGRIAYALLYLFLIKELIGFVFIYFKRLIAVLFLITIFPLVTIGYAVNKSGMGKSNAFSNWFKEFILNVFLQAFQAINYVVVMSVIFALTSGGGAGNVIFVLIALDYLSKGDELLRGLFSKMSGGGAHITPRNLSEALKTVATLELAKDLGRKVGNIGSRVVNFGTAMGNVRNSYQELELAKIREKEREETQRANAFRYSPANPENQAINDVEGNFDKVLNSKLYSADEVKEALDRLSIAKNDPNRRELFDEAFKRLSKEDRDKINRMMARNDAINETINGNVGINGQLTNREINLNVTLITDVLKGGRTGEFGRLYDYIDSQRMQDGKSLKSVMRSMQKGRVLNAEEQRVFANAQNFVGGATGMTATRAVEANVDSRGVVSGMRRGRIAGARAISTGRAVSSARAVSGGRAVSDGRVFTMKDSEKARLSINNIADMTRVRAVDASRKRAATPARVYTMTNAEKERVIAARTDRPTETRAALASDTVAIMSEYSRRINEEHSQDGISPEEAMELSRRLRNLYEEGRQAGDTETLAIIDKLKDQVGFNLEQFETVAALSAINNPDALSGDRAEQQHVLDEAYRVVRRVSEDSKDSVAQAMINRSEIDRILSGEIDFGSRPDEARKTVEEYRTDAEIQRLRERIEEEYRETKGMTVQEARAQLTKDIFKATAAGASATVGSLASVASGIGTVSLFAGASGDIDNPVKILGAVDLGISLEHGVESFIPGTTSGNGKKSIGKKIDKALDEHITTQHGKTKCERRTELDERIQRSENAQRKIENYRRYLQ